MKQARFLTPGEAARALGVSSSALRWWADTRKLKGVVRTQTGRRLFPRRQIELLREQRSENHK